MLFGIFGKPKYINVRLLPNFLICIALLPSCGDHVRGTKIEVQPAKRDIVPKSDSAKNKELIDKTMEIAKVSVSGEIAEIEAYVSIILDSSSTKTTKYRAFKVLHEDYPNAFTSIKDVKKTANRVEEALIRQAQIKAVKEKIAELNESEEGSK